MTSTSDGTMKVTPSLRKEILTACRQHVGGFGMAVEVGLRGEPDWLPNALLWDWEENDLGETVRLGELTEINEDPDYPGMAYLDCYCYAGKGYERELTDNCYVAIKDGKVVGATSDEMELSAMLRDALGVETE